MVAAIRAPVPVTLERAAIIRVQVPEILVRVEIVQVPGLASLVTAAKAETQVKAANPEKMAILVQAHLANPAKVQEPARGPMVAQFPRGLDTLSARHEQARGCR